MTGRSASKVVGVGMHRTGTSSLRRAFNILGFRCLEDSGCWFMADIDRHGDIIFRSTADLDLYQAYADNPVPLFFRELDEMFPGSKFILTHRDVEEWADSVEHIFAAWRDSWRSLPEGPLIAACHKALYGIDGFDRDRGKRAYRRHHEAVRDHFKNRPGDLLELDMTRGVEWDAICRFLQTPVPAAPFPRLNTRVDVS